MCAADLDDVWADEEEDDDADDGADGELTYSVTEYLDEVQGVLTRELRGAWVQGEIADFKPTRSGHTYFSLIEEDDEGRRCVLNVNYWRGKQAQLTPKLARHGLVLADGLQVRLRCTRTSTRCAVRSACRSTTSPRVTRWANFSGSVMRCCANCAKRDCST